MPQQPATSTDRLANVIQVIQLGRKTGVLTVERESGTRLAQGVVYFVNGLMTQASAHQLRVLAAFQWFNTWGSCRFTFTLSDSKLATNKLVSLRRTHRPASEHESVQDTDLTIGNQALTRVLSRSDTENNHIRQHHLSPHTTPARIPIRVCSLEDAVVHIERMQLSGIHRHLFLLLDGHRTTTELARLMGRRSVEVDDLLRDLERADVIRL
jgi:hypothetical protein